MIIKTQDGTGIYNYKNLEGVAVENERIYAIGAKDSYRIGEYDNEEEAKVVLGNLIQYFLLNNPYFELPSKGFSSKESVE